MSAQPSHKNDRAEEFARWRRRDHANLEAIQNLVISRIAGETGVEMPPNVRHLISALQGSHGGGEVAYEEFSRDYLTIGRQLQFTGSEGAIRQRVRRWIETSCGGSVRRRSSCSASSRAATSSGSAPTARPSAKPQSSSTSSSRRPTRPSSARVSELWKGNPVRRIKPHPGKALAAQVEWLHKELPVLKPEPAREGESETGPAKMPAGEYARKREEAIVKALEATADGIEEREGDADLWLEKIEKLVRRMRLSRVKTEGARRSWIMPSAEDDNEGPEPPEGGDSGTANTGITPEPPAASPEAYLGITDDTQASPESLDNTGENECETLVWALTLAAMGVRVFPLNWVFDGVCSCPEGSECRSAGKHPLARLAPRGVKDATTDEAVIRRWFTAEPYANLGVAMGGQLRLLAVDVDPRAGGDASLCDLVEAHGDDWLETFTVKTGGLGNHFIFALPEGLEVHRGKLAPGVDLKAEGGYLVAPPSLHASGRRYEVEKALRFAPAPAWMIDELTRKPEEPPATAVDFQERRDRRASCGMVIVEGERNERLFKVGCALWGKGEVGSSAELLQRLMEVNFERVSPSLESAEVHKIAESISSRYVRGVPIK